MARQSKEPKTISVFKSSMSSQAFSKCHTATGELLQAYKTRWPEPPFWGWWIQQEREWLRAKSRRALNFIQSLPLTNASHSAVLQESHTVCFLLLYKANEQWACLEGGWQGCRLVTTRFESCARKQNTLTHTEEEQRMEDRQEYSTFPEYNSVYKNTLGSEDISVVPFVCYSHKFVGVP